MADSEHGENSPIREDEMHRDVPENVRSLVESMDTKWQRQFDSLSNLIKRAVSRSQPGEDEEESGEPPAKKTAATFDSNNADDVLILHADGDLDDQEEKLCISAKKIERSAAKLPQSCAGPGERMQRRRACRPKRGGCGAGGLDEWSVQNRDES